MQFPIIQTIDDVLPYIEGRRDIIVAQKEDENGIKYKVINYVINDDTTFNNEFRLECRGLKFMDTGEIIARPFHKFFNLNERAEEENPTTMASPSLMDFGVEHYVGDKLDGSMVHSVILGNKLRLMTKMGLTDVALKAEKVLRPEQRAWLEGFCESGWTAILEYTGPDNQIVLFYEQPNLTLLALRNMVTGEYAKPEFFNRDKVPFDFPRVFESPLTNERIEYIKGLSDCEGVVVQWPNGCHLKIKCDEYVEKHRICTGHTHEVHYLHLILDDLIDDVIPLKTGEFRGRLEKYVEDVNNTIINLVKWVHDATLRGCDWNQKKFAMAYKASPFASELFKCRRNGDYTVQDFKQFLKRKLNTQANLDRNRRFIDGIRLEL
jgi:RNA ligase